MGIETNVPCDINAASAAAPPPCADHVAHWLRLLMEPGQVTELRAIRKNQRIDAGFFDHAHVDDMACAAVELSNSGQFKGLYYVFNPVNPALLQRAPNQVRTGSYVPGGVTKDGDVKPSSGG